MRFRRTVGAVSMAGLLVSAPGCELVSGLADSDPVVRYEAEVLRVFEREHEWSPDPIAYLEASVRGTNTSDDTVQVLLPSCIPDLRAYRVGPSSAATDPAWQLRNRRDWPGGSWYGCPSIIGDKLRTVAPTESFVVGTGPVELAEVLGDSLDAGTYDFKLHLSTEVTRGTGQQTRELVIDLGDVELPESSFPLQTGYYPRDGFIYRLEVEPAEGTEPDGILRLVVTHSAPRTNALERDLRRDCPVQIRAYRSRAERDRIPAPRPLWRWPPKFPACGEEPMSVRLTPGGAFTMTSVVPRRTFAFEGADIDDFYLMVVIEVDGRPLRFGIDPS